jgi:hypothetical protein
MARLQPWQRESVAAFCGCRNSLRASTHPWFCLHFWPNTSRRHAQRSRLDQCALRGAPLSFLRQLLRMRQLLRRMSGQCRDQARPRQAFPIQLRLLQGLRNVRPGMPVRRHRHGTGGDLGTQSIRICCRMVSARGKRGFPNRRTKKRTYISIQQNTFPLKQLLPPPSHRASV